jgi:hypothetical protein
VCVHPVTAANVNARRPIPIQARDILRLRRLNPRCVVAPVVA